MIEAIDVSLIDDTEYLNEYGVKLRNLKNIKKINIFIGENNSGKSRLMRTLIKNSSLRIYSTTFLDSERKSHINSTRRTILTRIKSFNDNTENTKIELSKEVNDLNEVEFYVNISDLVYSLNIDRDKLMEPSRSNYSSIMDNLRSYSDKIARPKTGSSLSMPITSCNIFYIPILRGIECFNEYFNIKKTDILDSISMNENQRKSLEEYKSNSKNIYKNKVVKAYELPNATKVFTAENLYDEITNKLLGEESGRMFIKEFQDFISKEFYDGEEFTIIPQKSKGYLNVKIGANKDRALHDLGDGIKQLITILYKIYENKDKESIFFIEEPEINLHPGYQRKLIEILQSSIFDKHQYFITTHSNHLIDSCFDYSNISIYKFINVNKSNNTFKVINTSPNDVDMLQLLGVNNSSVFMSNCTIWVEGISDKILISKYLQVYLKNKGINKYKEDIHYSFVEYGGNNITHWAFIKDEDIATINSSGITNRCFIVCDNDDDSISKAKRKEKLKGIFGEENFCELTVREIENTINRNVLENTLFPNGADVKYLENYDKNIYADKATRMGTFIDKHYDLKKKYGNNSTGTITGKLDFAKKVANNINDINDLSTQAKNLCEKILKFIENSNNN